MRVSTVRSPSELNHFNRLAGLDSNLSESSHLLKLRLVTRPFHFTEETIRVNRRVH